MIAEKDQRQERPNRDQNGDYGIAGRDAFTIANQER